MSGLQYRLATPEDLTAASRLVRQVFDAQVAPLYEAEGCALFYRFIEPAVWAERDRVAPRTWLAFAGRKLVGVAHVRIGDETAVGVADAFAGGVGGIHFGATQGFELLPLILGIGRRYQGQAQADDTQKGGKAGKMEGRLVHHALLWSNRCVILKTWRSHTSMQRPQLVQSPERMRGCSCPTALRAGRIT